MKSPAKAHRPQTDSELKSNILSIIRNSQGKLFDEASTNISKLFGRQRKLESVIDVKQLASKVLRQLREDLAASHSTYIKRMNSDLIDFESNQRSNNAALKQMSSEELIKTIQALKQEILSLRSNEIFMKKCSSQMTAIKSAVQLCNMECIMLHYKDAHIDNQLSQKLLKILDEMAESIRREVKSTFEIESKGEGSGMRNLFSGEIQ